MDGERWCRVQHRQGGMVEARWGPSSMDRGCLLGGKRAKSADEGMDEGVSTGEGVQGA